MNFNFFQPTRIHFGAGRLAEIGAITKKYGPKVLLVTTDRNEAALKALYERVKKLLHDAGAEVYHFDRVVPNPTVSSIEDAVSMVRENCIEVILAVGGGSSMDTAKAVSLFYQADHIDWQAVWSGYTDPFAEYESISDPILPIITITTTSGTGSQVTQAMILSDPKHNEKNCIFHDKVFPKETIIDPQLMLTLPRNLTAVTGFDAFTHSFESFINDCASPYTRMIGLQAMKTIAETLPKLLDDLQNNELREQMAFADLLSGISLTNAAATIPHPLSEIIGGAVPRIPHGQCLASIYPAFVRYIVPKKPEKCAEVAELLAAALSCSRSEKVSDQLPELFDLFLDRIGLNKRLSELGVTEKELSVMESNELLDYLPFDTRDVLFGMIRSRY